MRALLVRLCGLSLLFFVFSVTASAQSTYLSMYSQPGDPFGGRHNENGKSFFYSETDGKWRVFVSDATPDGIPCGVTVDFETPDHQIYWLLSFGTRGIGSHLNPGYYDKAPRWAHGSYGMSIANGCGCGPIEGSFCVLDATFDLGGPGQPRLSSLLITFEQHYQGLPPALTGTLSYRSSATPVSCLKVVSLSNVVPPEPAILGQPFTYKIGLQGGVAPYTCEVFGGELPPGLTLQSDGLITGIPSAVGIYNVGVHAADSARIPGSSLHDIQLSYQLQVIEPPPPEPVSIFDGQPPNAFLGTQYSFPIITHGGLPPLHWEVAAGQLPEGLTLTDTAGIAGTPTSVGSFGFTARVVDSRGESANRDFTISVFQPPHIVSIAYKRKKGHLTVTGAFFDPAARLLIDGNEVHPKSQGDSSISVKKLTLTPGEHTIEVLNPNGGKATTSLTV